MICSSRCRVGAARPALPGACFLGYTDPAQHLSNVGFGSADDFDRGMSDVWHHSFRLSFPSFLWKSCLWYPRLLFLRCTRSCHSAVSLRFVFLRGMQEGPGGFHGVEAWARAGTTGLEEGRVRCRSVGYKANKNQIAEPTTRQAIYVVERGEAWVGCLVRHMANEESIAILAYSGPRESHDKPIPPLGLSGVKAPPSYFCFMAVSGQCRI